MQRSLETAVQGETASDSALAGVVLRMIAHDQETLRQGATASDGSMAAHDRQDMLRTYFHRPENRGWLLPTLRHHVDEYLHLEEAGRGIARGPASVASPPRRRFSWQDSGAYLVYLAAGALTYKSAVSDGESSKALIDYTYAGLATDAIAGLILLSRVWPEIERRLMRTHQYSVGERDLAQVLETHRQPILYALENKIDWR